MGSAWMKNHAGGRPTPNTVYSVQRVTKSGLEKPHSTFGQGASPNSGAMMMARAMMGKMPSLPIRPNTALRCLSTLKPREKISRNASPTAMEMVKGKFQKRLHLVLKETDFPTFWDDFCLPNLKKFRLHRWKIIMLGKKNVNDVRTGCLRRGDIATQRDFAESWKMVQNQEIQSNPSTAVAPPSQLKAVQFISFLQMSCFL